VDWALLLRTFGAVFLAELGDKTQVATFCFAASGRSFWSVFLGSSLALTATSLLACLLGSTLSRLLPLRWVHLVAGVLFVVLGVVFILRNLRG